ISVNGVATFRFSLAGPTRVLEGATAVQGQIQLAQPAAANVVVQLASSNPARLNVPSSIVIAAGSSSASFNLTVVDDTLLNGTEQAVISASAAGYFGLPIVVLVDDDETAGIQLRLPSRATEGAGLLSKSGSIKLSRRVDRAVHVTLS